MRAAGTWGFVFGVSDTSIKWEGCGGADGIDVRPPAAPSPRQVRGPGWMLSLLLSHTPLSTTKVQAYQSSHRSSRQCSDSDKYVRCALCLRPDHPSVSSALVSGSIQQCLAVVSFTLIPCANHQRHPMCSKPDCCSWLRSSVKPGDFWDLDDCKPSLQTP
jgi:hypothetical protein